MGIKTTDSARAVAGYNWQRQREKASSGVTTLSIFAPQLSVRPVPPPDACSPYLARNQAPAVVYGRRAVTSICCIKLVETYNTTCKQIYCPIEVVFISIYRSDNELSRCVLTHTYTSEDLAGYGI